MWDDMIEYDIREQTLVVNEQFLDYDGLDTPVEAYLYYAPLPNSVGKLHTQVGVDYRETKLEGVFKGALKTVIPQYQALSLNREGRSDAEQRLSDILEGELAEMYIDFKRVQIKDVDLPTKISKMIEKAKEKDERKKQSFVSDLVYSFFWFYGEVYSFLSIAYYKINFIVSNYKSIIRVSVAFFIPFTNRFHLMSL